MTLSTRTRLMIAVGGLVVVAVAVQVVAVVVRTESKSTAAYDGISTVDLDVGNGSVELVAASSPSLELDQRSTYTFRKPRVTTKVEGNRLVVRQRCSGLKLGGCKVSITLRVPAAVSVTGHIANGNATLEETKGPVVLRNENGSITSTRTYGALDLQSENGGISGDDLQSLDVKAKTSNGRLILGFAGSPNTVQAESANGAVSVLVPRRSDSYAVAADSANGKTTIDVKTDPDSPRTIKAHSDNGAVTVGPGK